MELDEAPSPPQGAPGKRSPGRAGRDLPAAIAVGVGMGAAVLGSIYTYRPAFVAVVALAVVVGVYELVSAVATSGRRLPWIPIAAGAVAMLAVAYERGNEALFLAFLLTVGAALLWRLADGANGFLPDLSASVFVITYVPLLAGFAILLVRPSDGPSRVVAFIATVVCSDVGGYTAGVLFGRHPMAPTVSPKKSWEGFVGSSVACVGAGIGFLTLLFDQPWWHGALFGLAVVCSATVGDLGESMVKRDLGIKDMGTLLPGHGGIMDRLDSLLPTAPVAWLVLQALASGHS